MFGVEEFSAIINPPESAILAVGSIRDDVRIDQGQVLPAKVMTISLSVDHRVIDGVMAAKFLGTVKQLLENPQQITG
jgi:pyruvate dehydrogenase E2 component (dihydrolipoamide acetyltransferase)